MLYLKHGEPLRYGKELENGLVMDKFTMSGKANPAEGETLVHDEKEASGALAFYLSRLSHPEYPVPVGVFRNVQRPSYYDAMKGQIDAAVAKKAPSLDSLFNSGSTWTVE
jgi:2-oxoglutarate ferredoxin oxidoreductase subunit beta